MATCVQCKHWEREDPMNLSSKRGICTRNPPQILVVPTPQGIQATTQFPVTLREQHCGEFSPRVSLSGGPSS